VEGVVAVTEVAVVVVEAGLEAVVDEVDTVVVAAAVAVETDHRADALARPRVEVVVVVEAEEVAVRARGTGLVKNATTVTLQEGSNATDVKLLNLAVVVAAAEAVVAVVDTKGETIDAETNAVGMIDAAEKDVTTGGTTDAGTTAEDATNAAATAVVVAEAGVEVEVPEMETGHATNVELTISRAELNASSAEILNRVLVFKN